MPEGTSIFLPPFGVISRLCFVVIRNEQMILFIDHVDLLILGFIQVFLDPFDQFLCSFYIVFIFRGFEKILFHTFRDRKLFLVFTLLFSGVIRIYFMEIFFGKFFLKSNLSVFDFSFVFIKAEKKFIFPWREFLNQAAIL